ncbi:MAG: hypothetical protein RLZZ546_2451 [Bacteroidota bacterium]|jgi:hypothetical protein
MISNVNEFIESCKLMLREGINEHKVIDGVLTRCTNFENEKIEVIKSLSDYSLIINKKENNTKNTVVSLDKEGYVCKIDSDGWKELVEELELI